MNNKGTFDNPIDRAELICDKPVTSSEAYEVKGIRSKLLVVLAMAFFLTTGCAAGKKTVTHQEAPKKPVASAIKKSTKKSEKPSNANLDMRKEGDEGEGDEEMEKKKEWIRELKRLRYDKEYYMKCYNNWECDIV